MTVKELIKLLQEEDENAEIGVWMDSGFWTTDNISIQTREGTLIIEGYWNG